MESKVDKIEALAGQLRSPDEETRRSTVTCLAGHPLEETRDYLFAALGDESWRVRKEAVDALLASPVSEEITEDIVALLAAHDNAGLRNSAVEALERLGSRAVPVLCRHGGDADHDVRKFILDILGSIGDAGALPLLISALADPEPNVCAAAAENLGKIGDSRAVPQLLQALEKTDIWLRYTILEALGRIGKPVPMSVIAPMAGENLLKKAVFDCLGAIGDGEAIPLLMEGIRERVRNVREAAVAALMKVRERLPESERMLLVDGRLREFNGAPFVEGLLGSLDASDRDLLEALAGVLGLIGDERAIGELLHLCREERMRACALQAIRSMGEKAAATIMARYPAGDDDERCFIAYLCGELRFPACAPLLVAGMRGESSLLRRVSAIAAGKSGLPGMITDITPLLEETDPGVRDGAIEALSLLAKEEGEAVQRIAVRLAATGDPEKRRDAALLFSALADADRLSLLIKDEDPMVRRAAVNALAGIRNEAGVGHLLLALVDEDPDVRSAAAGALGEAGGEEVLAPLLLVLKDEDTGVKCAALKSLARLGHGGALQAVVDLLQSATDGLLTITALETVVGIGGEGVLGVVKKALENRDEEVVKTAIDILSRHGDEWLDAFGERLLSHPHWDVRRCFIRIMALKLGEKALPRLKSALDCEADDLVREQILDIMDRYQ
jgi:HEAT repeat protein